VSERTLSHNKHQELIRELGVKLKSPEQVTPPPGLSTGWIGLDRYLLWHGFPKGALSLMVCEAGGATTLWMQSAARVTSMGQWAAWINDSSSSLTPWSLRHRGVDLSRLLCISQPATERQVLWALQELMSLDMFELIGCNLGRLRLREHQILKLKKIALRHQTALVLFVPTANVLRSSYYSLILHFEKDFVHVERALHRPTPHSMERRDLYADTLPLLATGHHALCG
jgi:recombination protein RecA